MTIDTKGLESGHRLDAKKYMWRPDLGAEIGWAPWSRLGLSVELGGSIGWQSPINTVYIADGYTPFDRGSRVSRGWLGVSWFRR